MARWRNGQAISARRRTPEALAELDAFIGDAESRGALDEWRRGRAVRLYVEGERVVAIHTAFGVCRGSVNLWLRWYETMGVDGLRTWKPPGAPRKLTDGQRAEIASIVEGGPQAAGFTSGMWTGRMVGALIEERYGVRYHPHNIPPLLHELGFSVQRPRKRLARADAEAQATWLRERLPDTKKKPQPVEGS